MTSRLDQFEKLERENAALRDQVRTLQNLLQGDKYTATASEAAALATARTLREKLRGLLDAADYVTRANEPIDDETPVCYHDLKAAVAAARETLKP